MNISPRGRSQTRRATLRPANLAAVLLLLVVAACRPPEPSTGAGSGNMSAPSEASGLRLRVEVEPLSVGPATVTVHVLDGSTGVRGATVEVQGDMSHAGMQPVIANAAEVAAGEYRTESFAFSMAGDWFVIASVETTDGRSATAETFVNVSSR